MAVTIPASGTGTATPVVATDLVAAGHIQQVRHVVKSAKRTYATSAAIAAGGQSTLDSDQISAGLVGHLLTLKVAASVPLKVEVRTVENGVAGANQVVDFGRSITVTLPSRGFIFVAHDATVGLDAFRVVVTNLDTSQPADVYVTFCYEEV